MNAIVPVAETLLTENKSASTKPLIIIGTGPVGIRALQSFVAANPDKPVLIFGNEPWEPYNRVQLSSFLAGDVNWESLTKEQTIPDSELIDCHFHNEIVSIHTKERYVIDAYGEQHFYSNLIIATGSNPFKPDIPGMELRKIYCFRDFKDTQHLYARRTRTRRTVILGGGLLGLETARAMAKHGTEVIVIDHAPHLMNQQLDEFASELLREELLKLGIQIYLSVGIKKINGETNVESIELTDGRLINCDTLIISAGIKPNKDIARKAGLSVNRGIRVNNMMQTSAENIYAVGECSEHNGRCYGLVAPGYEQAEVAIAAISGKNVSYTGTVTTTQLKVVGVDVFSIGELELDSEYPRYQHITWSVPEKGIYRKLILAQRKIVGAMSVGEWGSVSRVRDAVSREIFVWPWQVSRFLKTGELWKESDANSPASWPATAKVCNCRNVSRGQCSKAINSGCDSVEKISTATGAGTVCGSCKPLLATLLGSDASSVPAIRYSSAVIALSIFAAIICAVIFWLPAVTYAETVENNSGIDQFWRSSLLKQVTGYSILTLIVIGLFISLRKRVKKFTFLGFPVWRVIHITLGSVALLSLFLHTGFRFGSNLNFYLMSAFVLITLAGVLTSIVLTIQHKLPIRSGRTLQRASTWIHILLFWPLPVLLGFHIFKVYYF